MNDTGGNDGSAAWHGEEAQAVLSKLESAPTGLTGAEAHARLERYGANVLPRARGMSIPKLIWRQVNNPLVFVLLGSAVLALVMREVVDGLVVLAVVVLNTIIGFIQEFRAGKAIEALVDLVPNTAAALRDGGQVSVPAEQLVPGDIVVLQSGDKVPADMRLIAARGLRIEEAALTGESVPVDKRPDAVAVASVLAERHNMVYSGTLVTGGTGTAVIVETGARTELGRISSLLNEAAELETPLTIQIGKVGKLLTIVIGAVSVLLMGVGLLRGESVVDAILAAITLAVAAIPEGLPAIITIALAIGVQRMAKRKAVIRKLPAVETLGSTTVICSDKTGTLTRGEMTVQVLWTAGSGRFEISGVGYEPRGDITWNGERVRDVPGEAEELLKAGVLCNDSSLYEKNGLWQVSGDPTEGALVVAAEKVGMKTAEIRQKWTRKDAIPFESERQYMATLHTAEEYHPVVYLKGAAEVVVPRCKMQAGNPAYLTWVLDQANELATEGMRVLAIASKRADGTSGELHEDDTREGFTFLGYEAMIDPPRPEAIEAIRACHRAGIQVKMITGDHRATAEAIGRQLGLVREGEKVYTGEEIQRLDEEAIKGAASGSNVFARVAPEHKLRLVRALQAQGHVAAMTGDGVNDAPALKQANIGVAMGVAGTAVAKESADMVLADDNFASIEAAVEEGRRVYDNLIKSLAFVLPTNIGEALIILVAVIFAPIQNGSLLMPMEPVQILWINLVATVALALPLAFEAMEPGVMQRPPRSPDSPVLGGFVLFRTIFVALIMAGAALGLFLIDYYRELNGGTAQPLALARAQTVAVTTVILFQIFYLLQCRSLKAPFFQIGVWTNPYVYAGIAVLLVLQLGFVYLPFMNRLFSSAPLDGDAWLRAVAAAVIVLPLISLEKWWRRRKDDGEGGRPGQLGPAHEAGVNGGAARTTPQMTEQGAAVYSGRS